MLEQKTSGATAVGDVPDVVRDFQHRVQTQPTLAVAVATMQSLTEIVRNSSASTMMGLEKELHHAIDQLQSCYPSSISLNAGCQLFSRYVTRTSLDHKFTFAQSVTRILQRGETLAQMSSLSRSMVARYVDRFIRDGVTIMVHGYSRTVMTGLLHAANKSNKRFTVIVCEGRPQCDGYRVCNELSQAGIPNTLILDSSIAYSMERADIVLTGAEGVSESGGIINKIGTYGVAIIANALKKPLYVCCECYKFYRLYPLSQKDLPQSKNRQSPFIPVSNKNDVNTDNVDDRTNSFSVSNVHPMPKPSDFTIIDNPACDFTPPELISLLMTDLGILTPSAVSDELIKLYY